MKLTINHQRSVTAKTRVWSPLQLNFSKIFLLIYQPLVEQISLMKRESLTLWFCSFCFFLWNTIQVLNIWAILISIIWDSNGPKNYQKAIFSKKFRSRTKLMNMLNKQWNIGENNWEKPKPTIKQLPSGLFWSQIENCTHPRLEH